jgi:hypothetical protein
VPLAAPDFLVAYSMPLCSPPPPVVLEDWESAIPALGNGPAQAASQSLAKLKALSCSKSRDKSRQGQPLFRR